MKKLVKKPTKKTAAQKPAKKQVKKAAAKKKTAKPAPVVEAAEAPPVVAATANADADPCICNTCGSLNVQYPVWLSPNSGQTHDLFGSWNNGDNQFCEDCDSEGRDPNPSLMHKSEDVERFEMLRAKRIKLDAGASFEDLEDEEDEEDDNEEEEVAVETSTAPDIVDDETDDAIEAPAIPMEADGDDDVEAEDAARN